MTVTGPYPTNNPRRAGDQWRVTVKSGAVVQTHTFTTEDEAREFARGLRRSDDQSEAPR